MLVQNGEKTVPFYHIYNVSHVMKQASTGSAQSSTHVSKDEFRTLKTLYFQVSRGKL